MFYIDVSYLFAIGMMLGVKICALVLWPKEQLAPPPPPPSLTEWGYSPVSMEGASISSG